MISVREAESLITKNCSMAPIVEANISELSIEVLREDLLADRPMPSFDRVAMDGIAFSYSYWEMGRREFSIQGAQGAGEPVKALANKDNCLEVMTGAVLPENCDVVVRIEDVEISGSCARVSDQIQVTQWQNVHRQGSDHQAGDLLVREGALMLSPQWSIAASIGKSRVKISKRPQVAIVSTGNELVGVSDQPLSHQIRRSNPYALSTSLKAQGFNQVSLFHINDNSDVLLEKLGKIISHHDVILISGGVSMGKFDYVPGVLADLNIKKVFHKISQKPGKPMWFGVSEDRKMVFGLPGNPVSALICLHRYVMPALWKVLGQEALLGEKRPMVRLTEAIVFKKPMTLFQPVRLKYTTDGFIDADPVRCNGSGDFSSLALADGFIELGPEKDEFSSGKIFPMWSWRG